MLPSRTPESDKTRCQSAMSNPTTIHRRADRVVTVMAVGVVALAAACGGPSAAAQPAATAPPADAAAEQAILEPAAAEALKQLSATLAAAPAMTVQMTALREGRMPNQQLILIGATTAVAMLRPDRFVARVGSDLGNFELWYDGKAVTVLNPVENVYATTALRGDIDTAIRWIEGRLGVEIPIEPLLLANPYPALAEPGTTGVYVGPTFVHGIATDHYAFRSPGTDWEIWIETEGRKLPRRISVVDREAPGQSRVIVEFDDWNLSPRLNAQGFNFVPPPGAIQATEVLLPEVPK